MLFFLAGAPVWAGLCCLYSKDRYHKEPWGMLLWSVVYGLFSTFVIYGLGVWLKRTFPHAEGPFYTAFDTKTLFPFLWDICCGENQLRNSI